MPTNEPSLLRPEALQMAERNGVLRQFQRQLIQSHPEVWQSGAPRIEPARIQSFETGNAIAIHYHFPVGQLCVVLNFSDRIQELRLAIATGEWEVLMDSGAQSWGGSGPDLISRIFPPCPLKFPPRSLTFLQRLNYEN